MPGPKPQDLRGRRFGRLRVPPRAEYEYHHGRVYWPVVCECGAEKLVRASKLTEGRTVSCGCWRADPAVRSAARLQIPPARRELARIGH